MSIYELEERILFDGALPVDIAEVEDSQELEETLEPDISESENLSIAPEGEGTSSEDAEEGEGNVFDFTDPTNDLLSDSADPIDAALAALDDVQMPEGFEPDPDILIVRGLEFEHYESGMVEANTILIETEFGDTLGSILQRLKDELGDRKPVDIAITESVLEDVDTAESAAFLNELSELQTIDGEIDLITLEDTDDIQAPTSTSNSEIVFINSSVANAEEIVDDLPETSEVVYLTRGEDGIQEITAYLADRTDVDTIRIISHGNEGYFVLNGELIDNEYLAENSEMIASWQNALSEDADIMLYGCNLAANSEGQDLVQSLAEITDADVAAATFSTGNTNWALDFQTGEIESLPLTVDNYDYELATYEVTNTDDSGTGSLRWAIDEANATVGVEDDITFNFAVNDGTILLVTGELLITDDVNIIGGTANITVHGNNASRIFNIASGITVTIGDLTITNGYASSGGGILNLGTLTLTNSTVSGNNADSRGGGIYNYYYSDLTVTNSTISGNTARNGGGIYSRGTLTLTNSTITGNTASSDGGGIYNDNYDLTVTDSTISNNTAKYGGGIRNYFSDLAVTNSTINGNTASYDGGGIYNVYSTSNVIDSTISGNTASNDGGGIYNVQSSFTVTDSTISGNTANSYGGGIYNVNNSNFTVINSTISNNTAINNYGGGIYTGDNSNFTVTDSAISENTARDGGGIYNRNVCVVTNSTISENTASYSGGGIYNRSSTHVIDSTISGNTANYYGGGIYNYDSDLTVTNSTISGNTAYRHGGGIYNGYSSDLTVTDSTISENTVTGSSSYYGGGGIYNYYRSNCEVTNSTISGNTVNATGYYSGGGGIYNYDSDLTVTDSTITGNTVTATNRYSGGGGIYNYYNSNLTVNNSTISGNTATATNTYSGGGGIYNRGTLTLTNSTVSGNNASVGGGIYNYSGYNYITNSIIAYNYKTNETGYDDIFKVSGTVYGNYNISSFTDWGTGTGNQPYTYTSGKGNPLFADYETIVLDQIYKPVLTDNGGPTETVALIEGSIAKGNGVPTGNNGSQYAFWNGSIWVSVQNGTTEVPGATAIDKDQRGAFRDPASICVGAFDFGSSVYRSNSSGNWSDLNIWESSWNGEDWSAAEVIPYADNSLGIIVLHNVTVDFNITIDQATVETGGTITVGTDNVLTITDGFGTDLVLEGALDATSECEVVLSGNIVGAGTVSTSANTDFTYGYMGDQPVYSGFYNTITLLGSGVKSFSGTTTVYGGVFVNSSLTVAGEPAATTIVQAHETQGLAESGVFFVAFDNVVTIENMTIQNGSNGNGGGIYNEGTLSLTNATVSGNIGDNGGGIYNLGSLSLTNATVSGNDASRYHGGGIYNLGSLSLTNATVSGNTAATHGGGIYNEGTLTVNFSTVSGNTAETHGNGGGIYNEGTVTVNNSTISGNTAAKDGQGGGIYNSLGNVVVTNSTISGNVSSKHGGGIYNFKADLTITSSTISGNEAAVHGGGVYNAKSNFIVTNSIIAYNYNTELSGYNDIADDGTETTFGNYNISPFTDADWGGGTGNQAYTYTNGKGDPLFADYETILLNQIYKPVLADNYGPTYTVALASIGSIAKGTGVTVPGIDTDQRGVQRNPDEPDVGAFTFGPLYRTINTGDWSNLNIWQSSFNGEDWVAAVFLPYATTSQGITIQTGHTVTVDHNLSIDQATVEADGAITVGTDNTLTVVDGPGTDFTLEGTIAAGSDSSVLLSGSTAGAGTVSSSGGTLFAYDYAGDQTVFSGTYDAVILSGSGAKAFSGITTAYDGITVDSVMTSLTVTGELSTPTIVQAHETQGLATSGVFYIAPNNVVTIKYMTIRNGKADNGGGIFNAGTLAVNNVTVSGNTALYSGGGMFNTGTLAVNNVTISGNAAESGGGVFNADDATLVLTNATVSGNTADIDGAGIYSDSGSSLVATNSIIAYNYKSDLSGYDDIAYDETATMFGNFNVSPFTNAEWGDGTFNLPYTYTNGKGDTLFADYETIVLDHIYKPVLADNLGTIYTVALAAESIAGADGARTATHNEGGSGYAFYDGSNWVKVEDGITPVSGVEIFFDQRGFQRFSEAPSIGAYSIADYYRTADTGNWNDVSNWEVLRGDGLWAPTVFTPNANNSLGITVRDTHNITVNVDTTIDQTIVETGGTISVETGSTLTIVDGTGADLTVTGSLTNNGTLICNTDTEVLYDGANQNIAEASYHFLTLSGSGIKTFSGTTTAYGGVTVDSPLTITGSTSDPADTIVQAHETQGLATSRVFYIPAGNTVTIQNMTIRNGNASSGGGILNDKATLYVTNTTISGNSANAFGAGIYNDEATLYVTDSTISGNTATYDGGGIFNESSDLEVTNSTISGNTARNGGGIYNYNNSDLTVTNSTISGNTATVQYPYYGGFGGGIYNALSTSTVNNSTISGNTASNDGGGIYNVQSSFTVTDSTISGNTANSYGGGIYNVNNSNFTVINSTISNNTAINNYGGGIYTADNSNFTVTDSAISENTARDGGGIYNRNVCVVTNSTISDNTASYSGGGIYNRSSTHVIDSTISGNTANYYGGGIYNYDSDLTVTDSEISGNTANRRGGGIYNFKADLTVNNSTISGNTVNGSSSYYGGGGIYNYYYSDCVVTNSTISGNTVNATGYYSGGGGIFNYSNSTLTITDSTISGNTVNATNRYSGGGGIYNYSYRDLIVTNSTISGNTANATNSYSGGGGIFNRNVCVVTNSTISGNNASAGGGIYNYSGSNYITNSIIAYNYKSDETGYDDIYKRSGTVYGNYNISYFTAWGSTNYTYYDYDALGTDPGKGPTLFADYETIALNQIYKPVLADNGGPTYTVALAEGSIAEGNGVRTANNGTQYAFWNGSNWVRVENGYTSVPGAIEITEDQRGFPRDSSEPCAGAYYQEPSELGDMIDGLLSSDLEEDELINFEGIEAYNEQNPLFMTDLDKQLAGI